MIELGNTLKAAREAKGLSVSDIANRTRMMSSTVADLENEDFSHLPAPIYGRGFIKLYCEVVEIDPTPLIAEFNEICNGNREPAIRERAIMKPENDVPPPAEQTIFQQSVAEPVQEITPEPPPREQLDLFSTSAAPAAMPIQDPQPEPTETHGHVFARYASPIRDHAEKLPKIMPAIGRWCVVTILLALLVWGIAVGIRALYRATSNTAVPAPQDERTSVKPANAAPKSAASVKTDRKPINIPPLYID